MSSNLLSKRINELAENATSFETFDEIENYLFEELKRVICFHHPMGAGDILRVGCAFYLKIIYKVIDLKQREL